MDISKINADFGANTEPKDEYLMNLFGQAYQGRILCTAALAKIDAIQPFSDYKPEISADYRGYFMKCISENVPPALYVYAKVGKLIMSDVSDDYAAYYMYKDVASEIAICVVIGPHTVAENVEYGPPYKLPLPTIDPLQ